MTTTYILLRDNKESVPCTITDLKNLGLRSTDLIWVEGQSVCWQGPETIRELKELIGATPLKTTIDTEESHKEFQLKPATEKKHVFVPVPEVPVEDLKPGFNPIQRQSWQIPPQFRKIAVYAGLLIVGLTAGLLINKKLTRGTPVSKTESQQSGVPVNQQGQPIVEKNDTTDNAIETDVVPYPNSENENTEVTASAKQTDLRNKTAIKETLSVGDKPVITDPVTTNPDLNAEEKTKEEIPIEKEIKKTSIKEIYSQVAVKNSDYTVGSFGGIKNLELTVTNHSKYSLDEVEVMLSYFKPMNEFLKSEKLSFRSIPPGGSKTISVPKSSRGVKVSSKITSIESTDFLNNTAGL